MRPVLISLLLACVQASGQILLRVNDAPPVTVTAADLAKLPRHTAVLSNHGQQTSYEGVLVGDLLAQHGVNLGEGLRGKQLSSYVAALASDGYQVVFALAEFDPTIVDPGIIVADKRDGRPLPATDGSFRIVVPHDKRAARSLRLLREIDLVQLNK